MRLTIETTSSEPRYMTKVTKEVGYDDVDIWELADMIKEIMLGFGFGEKSIEELFNSEDTEKPVHNDEKEQKNV